jgi:hypothetical protein
LLRLVRDSASREQEGTELSVQGSLERPSDPLELAALGHWQQAFMGIPGAESPLWTDELRDQALRLELKGTTPETLAREVLARVVTEAPKELAGCIGELLQADDPELRLVALAATADLPADEQRPLLELGVVDHEAQVRRATAMCLTQVEQRWAVSLLRELSRDEDLAVRRTAVDGMAAVLPALTRQLMASPLGGIEQPRRVSSLLRQIRRQDEDVQTEGDDEAEGNDEAEVWPSAEGRLCLVPSAVLPDEEMTELETDQAAEHSVPESDEPSSNGPKKPEGLAAE